jgi:hypothetical protein
MARPEVIEVRVDGRLARADHLGEPAQHDLDLGRKAVEVHGLRLRESAASAALEIRSQFAQP